MKLKAQAIAFAAAAILASCVSMGTNYDPAAASELVPGMSQQEVIDRLGPPNSIAQMTDGTSRLVWVHSTGYAFGAKARSVALLFDKEGKLLEPIG